MFCCISRDTHRGMPLVRTSVTYSIGTYQLLFIAYLNMLTVVCVALTSVACIYLHYIHYQNKFFCCRSGYTYLIRLHHVCIFRLHHVCIFRISPLRIVQYYNKQSRICFTAVYTYHDTYPTRKSNPIHTSSLRIEYYMIYR